MVSAASMVAESARICGRVGLHGGMTSYLGCAWWDLELHGCYCMGACITCFGGNPFIRGRPLCVDILCVAGAGGYLTSDPVNPGYHSIEDF